MQVRVRTAYDQWTQLEELPRFMRAVKEVCRLDDAHLHRVAEIGQHPDHRIAWHATGGRRSAGVVTSHTIDDATTRVMVEMDREPDGMAQSAGSALGPDERQSRATSSASGS